jgi:hypothetical protein
VNASSPSRLSTLLIGSWRRGPMSPAEIEKLEVSSDFPDDECPPWKLPEAKWIRTKITCKFAFGSRVRYSWCKEKCRLFGASVCPRMNKPPILVCPFGFFSDQITCTECELRERCAAYRSWKIEQS